MIKKKAVFSVIAGAILGAVLLSGCTTANDPSATKSGEKKDLTFVLVSKVVHPWFDEVNKGAQAQAKALSEQLGVKVTVNYLAPPVADVAEQNTILQNAAATHPDGIALDPLDAVGNAQVISEIRKQGIPVVFFDSPTPEGSDITSVGNDFTEQGNIAAERLVKLLGGKGKVAIMQGVPTAPNHNQRYEAQKATLAKYPGITVVDGGIDNDDIQTAQSQAAAVMASNPDLAGYLMCDASAPTGIAAALKEAGKIGKIKVVGMDSLKPILETIRDGVLDSTSATVPQVQGSMSILMLWQSTLGIIIPKTVDTGIDVITKDNVAKYLDALK